MLAALVALAPVTSAVADEGHAHGGPGGVAAFGSAPVLWGLVALAGVLALFVLVRMVLVRQVAVAAGTAAGTSTLGAIRSFSRNARLFLTYSLFSELGSGIWTVLFNLYLLRLDFTIAYIGLFWLVNMVCHGGASLPIGLLADRYGRRLAFFMATTLSVVAQGGVLLTDNSVAILVLGGIAGVGQAAHGVTGAPFMMENSEPGERPHLFSLNAGFLQISRFGGNLAGGLIPLAWAVFLGVPDISPAAVRWALITGLPLTIGAALPLLFMQEKRAPFTGSFKDLVTFKNVVNMQVVLRLTLLSLLFGTAFGLTIRFFNIFFVNAHGASDSQIGAILALGALAGVGTIFLSPVIGQRFGRAAGILITQGLSVPLLLLMAMVPSLSVVTFLFLARGAVYSLAMPLREQLTMEFVTARERGTAAGFTHTAFDMGGGGGAILAGLLIVDNGFVPTFTVAAVLILIPAVLYYRFFGPMEAGRRAPLAAASAAGD
ncbi:MAG: MFS transporter [Chloroflexi bacterium]|nr:MFS transporter [Chloroflexota bacterium]